MKASIVRTFAILGLSASITFAQESLPVVLTSPHGPAPLSSIASTSQTSSNCPFGVDPSVDTYPEILTYLQSNGFNNLVGQLILLQSIIFTTPGVDPSAALIVLQDFAIGSACALWEQGEFFPGLSTPPPTS